MGNVDVTVSIRCNQKLEIQTVAKVHYRQLLQKTTHLARSKNVSAKGRRTVSPQLMLVISDKRTAHNARTFLTH